jgi:hypothetical protein
MNARFSVLLKYAKIRALDLQAETGKHIYPDMALCIPIKVVVVYKHTILFPSLDFAFPHAWDINHFANAIVFAAFDIRRLGDNKSETRVLVSKHDVDNLWPIL